MKDDLPLVGITANRLVDDQVHRDWLRRRYIDALERHAGVGVVILPTCNTEVKESLPALARLDGLLLTGDESNLDPGIFCGASGAGYDYARDLRDRYRDRLSAVALRTALSLGMPVLGICRGLQELNVHLGGTLHSNLLARPDGLDHTEDTSLPRDQQYEPVHAVTLPDSGVLRGLLGRNVLWVNSLHAQGIDTLASGLAIEALASDGLIEAVRVRHSPTFQLAVQWHPEWHVDKDTASQILFRAFGEACGNYHASRGHQSRRMAVQPDALSF